MYENWKWAKKWNIHWILILINGTIQIIIYGTISLARCHQMTSLCSDSFSKTHFMAQIEYEQQQRKKSPLW